MSNFEMGMEEADTAPNQPEETMGARFNVSIRRPGSGVQEHFTEPYLMPPYHGRNGSNERTVPSIVQTPLGGMVPGPNAIAPAIVVGEDYRHPTSNAEHGWGSGIDDGYPEGCPVPLR